MHKCLKCGKIYEKEEDVPIISGCECGSKFFVFLKEEDKEDTTAVLDRVTLDELDKIEQRIIEKKESETSKSISQKISKETTTLSIPKKKGSFGIETVKTVKPGVYEINIEALLSGAPFIVLQKGETYIIHLSSVFKSKKRPSSLL
ncbi:Zn-ribbon domain-containing protein [Candidatus Undinarchaeota archaeon]